MQLLGRDKASTNVFCNSLGIRVLGSLCVGKYNDTMIIKPMMTSKGGKALNPIGAVEVLGGFVLTAGPPCLGIYWECLSLMHSDCIPYVVPPRCLDDILRCGVYGTFAMAYHEM
jgi:hypothetical protein